MLRLEGNVANPISAQCALTETNSQLFNTNHQSSNHHYRAIASINEQESFSQRLRNALNQVGWKSLGASGLREFNVRSERKVTPHAAHKWLAGDAISNQERIQILARWLRVPA